MGPHATKLSLTNAGSVCGVNFNAFREVAHKVGRVDFYALEYARSTAEGRKRIYDTVATISLLTV